MISTKGRYALRVMIDLAQHKDEEYVPLNEIAIRQEISEKYLEIVLKILVKKKLLKGRHRMNLKTAVFLRQNSGKDLKATW